MLLPSFCAADYLATAPTVVETFHFEVPPLSLVVRPALPPRRFRT